DVLFVAQTRRSWFKVASSSLCGCRAVNEGTQDEMEPAIPTRLEAVGSDLLGVKLRLTAQVLSYDPSTGLALLWSRDVAVLVDVSNCVSAWAGWVNERLCTVTAAGYLERAPADLRAPGLPKHFPLPAPNMDSSVVLRAVSVVDAKGMDMESCPLPPPHTMYPDTADDVLYRPLAAHPVSNARGDPLPPFPPKPSPPRDAPAPVFLSVEHPAVRQLVADLDVIVAWDSSYQFLPRRIPCSEVAFALTALALFSHPTDHLHPVFWAPERRENTAATVQRVLESGQNLIIPMVWMGVAHALSTLAAQEQPRAPPPALDRPVGAKSVQSPQRLPRVTRAAAARQTQAQQKN
ncbi:hypothetical protein C8R46DRAFT_1241846, partial [Mycena filopes]